MSSKYRPFNGLEEFEPLADYWFYHVDRPDQRLKVVWYGTHSVLFYDGEYVSYEELLKDYRFVGRKQLCGVRIDA